MKQISPSNGPITAGAGRLWRLVRSLLGLALIVSAFGATLHPVAAHDAKVVGPDGKVHQPIEVTLAADRTPQPGDVVNLTMAATPYLNGPALTLKWVLPAGLELLGGTTDESFAAIAPGQTVQSQRQVRFPSVGTYKVAVSATLSPNPAQQLAYADVLYFIVAADGTSRITDIDPAAQSPLGSTMQSDIHLLGPTVNAAAANGDPCFKVSGTIRRIERTITFGGILPDALVPVRFALIEVREEDLIADDVQEYGITDANGNYSFEFCDNDGLFDDTLELYVRLYASIYEQKDGFEIVYVEDSSYIDEMYYYDSTIFSSGGGDFDVSMDLDTTQSGPFNIADTIFEAWTFWKESGGASDGDNAVDITAEVHWEPGYVDYGTLNTYYDQAQEEITIGTVRDPDTWDDSSIIHEYGHMIEDNYSCDESLGGSHNFTDILDDEEFAWSEGYQNYFQSAVRQGRGWPDAKYYFDVDDTGAIGFADLELWHKDNPMLVDPRNEAAIAALFWDLIDGSDPINDGQDRVLHGHAMIQEVYTDDEFADQGVGDETCSVDRFFQAWQALDKPANAATAAVVIQNVGGDSPFTVASAGAAGDTASAAQVVTAQASPTALDYQWWKHLILTVDRSNSMAGDPINAVKTVLNEQVADITNSPKGVEFSLASFENSNLNNTTLLAGKFYADDVTPVINSITTSSANDDTCPVESLRAMSQAIGDKFQGEAWLFTDGDAPGTAAANASVNTLVKSLQSHKLKQSIALLGGCDGFISPPLATTGATQKHLGLAADASQSSGIVPYLLTALGSGGQFLYVGESQMNEAADILRAQLSHSAGAGRWSDYVSNTPTYRYDKLASWDYKWIDTSVAAGGTNHGVLFANSPLAVTLPNAFTYYGVAGQTTAQVDQYGYLTFGTAQSSQSQNTTLPNAATPNNALYVLWDQLDWNNPPGVVAADQVSAAAVPQVDVYSKAEGDWFAIETRGFRTNAPERAYQVLLNATTGEIRYQYGNVGTDAGTATIGLENSTGTAAVQVSLNDVNGASNNMGYYFTPAPAQPSKTFTVAVDSLMNSVGFLLTGYSGSFDPLAVRYPDNTAVSCADTANVLCITLDRVQYVQVKTNGRNGIWQATVSAGNTGAGTFSFSTLGAGSINPASNSDRSRSTGPQRFALQIERPVTGNVLDGWFTKPNGSRFGSQFRFYDDGAHDDGKAGDGRFGSDDFTPPSAGIGYLWLGGSADGAAFKRAEPTPFDFQPLAVTAQGDGVNYGDVTVLSFTIQNLDSARHCYDRAAAVPTGWSYDWKMTPAEFLSGLCLNGGESATRTIEIKLAATSPNTLPSGTTGEVAVTFVEKEVGQMSDSATAQVTRRRPPALIEFKNHSGPSYLRPTGVDTTTLSVFVFDDQLTSVADGTEVTFSTTLGSIQPAGVTSKGRLYPVFTAGTVEGKAVVTAMAGSAIATTTVTIQAPYADLIDLTSSAVAASVQSPDATLTTTVRDRWGSPLANQTVRLSVAGDGDNGTINGGEVITGTTDAAGQLTATFTRGERPGTVIALAQLIVTENGQPHVALEDQLVIIVTDGATSKTYLPLVNR